MKMDVDVKLKFVEGRVFLNFWDSLRGRDVICQVEDDGRLMKFVHSASENAELESQRAGHDPYEKTEITLKEFVELVSGRVPGLRKERGK